MYLWRCSGSCFLLLVGGLSLALNGCSGGGGSNDVGVTATVQTGLNQRPSNASCVAPPRPVSNATYTTQQVFPNLIFTSPVAMQQPPSDPSRWFVLEQPGLVKVFANTPSSAAANVVIDITDRVTSGGEKGLLGMAFHPNFGIPNTPHNNEIFLSYTSGNQSRISRFTSDDGGNTLDPNSEQILLSLTQPYSNHNGGHIAFGSDGYLYIGFGDGGSGGDPLGHGQNKNTLLGAMLRIDVDGGTPYAIPVDNPLVGQPNVRSEIWAWGFRNPWRWSFDTATQKLWVGDVGQNQYEEIDVVEASGNYGWNIREGAHCYNADSCDTSGLIDPIAEYDHTTGGNSVTGGFVYRGSQIESLQGAYLYGDFSNGKIWFLPDTTQSNATPQLLEDTNLNISSFAQGLNGEVYVVNYGGTLHQVVEQSNAGTDTIAQRLSETGCVNTDNPSEPASGLIPYDIQAPFWSDGASKQRWLALPDNTTISIDGQNDWEFPPGSVLMKHFLLNNQLIETRLLMRHPDGEWGGYSYEWNEAQTEALLVTGGKTKTIGGQSWNYPSQSECMQCHTQAAKRALGPETAQMNRAITYPSTGRNANQLSTFETIGLFSEALADTPTNLPVLAEPSGTGDLHHRARAYLHTNCAQCHQPQGPAPVSMDLRYDTPMGQTATCNTEPDQTDLGIANARLIIPGNTGSSLLVQRMKRRDVHGMPPLGSNAIDNSGVALLEFWVNSMGSDCIPPGSEDYP